MLSDFIKFFHAAQYKGILFFLLPTIVSGCSEKVLASGGQPYVRTSILIDERSRLTVSRTEGSALDILSFNDDRLKRLDSYMRIENFSGTSFHSTSTGGDKIIFLLYGSKNDTYQWAEINSYGTLRKMYCNLEDETREAPVMTGLCRCEAGSAEAAVTLTPLSSTVMISSLSCDFSGTLYSDLEVTDVKAYLTNVNAVSGITQENPQNNVRLINAGTLNQYDVRCFADTSLIVQAITDRLGRKSVRMKNGFMCYPDSGCNTRTRLVIEGNIAGSTYYWTLNAGGESGIERNKVYNYSIRIRRKGTTDPDIPIETQDIDFNLNIKPWTEKEEYQVEF